ncbi:Nucleic acid-binding, OB-fold containing protein [Trema orientale]|uniref:Nucleic acid-binding, OB-fold containing protein n=1 Tax=Trema orientale TaxID=63057 RepID=A0A2P5F5X9_TREOI|nr:Nucleic acid-binding, OB-fold containing protein [Trema orientale]
MEIHQQQQQEDPFLRFIDYSRSVLCPEDDEDSDHPIGNGSDTRRVPSWSWIASRILKTCSAYSSGVTPAILLSDLSQAWNEQRRDGVSKKRPECMRKKKRRRSKLPNTVTIDSICEKNFLSLSSVLECVVVEAFVLPGTNIYMLTLGDFWSSNTIDLYLHRRYYDLVDPQSGILKKGREILLTGCYLRTAAEGSGYPRLLPTEYLVILLDEDEDDDAMIIGAQFCSDSFSSISLDAVNQGASYSLYGRIEFIGPLEIHGKFGSLQRKQITLVDDDGVKIKFLLWGEQVLLANLFGVGSMLALDRPYIASSQESAIDESNELCLEYGSATQLFLVCVTLTQNWCQGTGLLSTLDLTPGPKVSQVSLPRDSQGSLDFSSYPFQPFVTDLHDKMTGISLYGVVINIMKDRSTTQAIFSLRIQDTTGEIWAKLHFTKSWSLGRLSPGHTVYISGLTCSLTKQKCLEASWFENDTGASFINLSCMPALLNSPCLQKLSNLSNLSTQTTSSQVVRVWLEMAHFHVSTRLSHALCGHLVNRTPSGYMECSFCHYNCDSEIVRSFHLKISLADETGKIFAWSTGQTAVELLQVSPDEFYELPEEEQVMYPSSLDNERFMVALVNCKMEGYGLINDNDSVSWEITRASKCE